MKTKAKKELHSKTGEELKVLLKTVKDEFFSLQLEHAQQKLKNTSSLLHKRKDIARINTILQEKNLAAARQE